MAVKGKDLSYEAQEPAFLRRLRAQQAGRGDPDRHERPTARPSRPKKEGADEDDEPTIVDEENNSISKDEYETLLKSQELKASTEDDVKTEVEGTSDPLASAKSSKQETIEVGQALKKRKAAKIVGESDSKKHDDVPQPAPLKRLKKRSKPVALSFSDEAG